MIGEIGTIEQGSGVEGQHQGGVDGVGDGEEDHQDGGWVRPQPHVDQHHHGEQVEDCAHHS